MPCGTGNQLNITFALVFKYTGMVVAYYYNIKFFYGGFSNAYISRIQVIKQCSKYKKKILRD